MVVIGSHRMRKGGGGGREKAQGGGPTPGWRGPRGWAAALLSIALLAAAYLPAAGAYGMAGREVDEFGRLKGLRFLHIPKTGTSFIIVLRNYLTACKIKDKTCSGQHGGSDPKYLFAEGTPMYVESCNGALRQACNKKRYHDYYHTTGPSNYVTLLRQPIEHAISGLSYTNKLRASSGQEPMSVTDYVALISNIHVKMLSGYPVLSSVSPDTLPGMLTLARQRLNSTVFFGISDHWNTTICLFHKELNGPGPRPSEFVNARKTTEKTSLSEAEMAVVQRATRYDAVLYEEALAHFKARAERYDCPLV